jgi:DNA polymerase sigma
MNQKDFQIFSLFASSVRERFSDARIWAFGSRVTGTPTEESDLDVCAVVNTLNDTVDQAVIESLSKQAHSIKTSPVGCMRRLTCVNGLIIEKCLLFQPNEQ